MKVDEERQCCVLLTVLLLLYMCLHFMCTDKNLILYHIAKTIGGNYKFGG